MPTPSNQNPFPNDKTENAADRLGRVHVAAPCTASWDAMPGGERVRSCEKCAHKVYNLSAMTADDAAQLVTRAEGKNPERVCVRFYRRSDGTMLTQDCPVGVRALRRKAARRVSAAFAGVSVLFGMNLTNKTREEQPRLVQMVLNAIDPPPAVELPAPAPISEPAPRFTATAGMVSLPIARNVPPPSPETEIVLGGIEGPQETLGNTAGAMAAGQVTVGVPPSSFEGGPEPAPPVPDKSFLNGAEGSEDTAAPLIPVAPRADPFVSHTITVGQASVKASNAHKNERPHP